MVNNRVRNAVLGCNLKSDRMISVRFQTKPFNITVIQVSAPASNAEEAEVEQFYEDLQDLLRESFPRQVDKNSRGPQGERGLEFSRRKKGQTFFSPLHSLGLYNNNVSCLRTVSGKILLANPIILNGKLWE